MNQADVSKLVSKLRFKIPPKHRRLANPQGPEGRLNKLRKTVTGLIRHERIEVNYNRGDETRQYAERLISEAIRHGDCHKQTMETADFWLLEKELVHKLFKVLVPRYENCRTAFTTMYKAPRSFPSRNTEAVILELKGNPYPPVVNKQSNNKLSIHNILLNAAKYEYRQTKYAEIAKKMKHVEVKTDTNKTTENTNNGEI